MNGNPENLGWVTANESYRVGVTRYRRISFSWLQPAGLFAAYAVLGALALSPLLWASVPPLIDYPNHLARMAILANLGPPELHANYVADWRLLPNLAMDIIVPPLVRMMPLEVAGRLFIGATMILLVAGTAALHRALHGRVGLWPLCSLLFIYNFVLWYGFLNYLFGLGVVLLGFAGWVSSAKWRPLPRIVVFAGVAGLIFVLHLFAFGIYGLLVASYELGSSLRERGGIRIARHVATSLGQFVPAACLWVWSLGNGGPEYVAYGGFTHKLSVILAPVSFSNPATLFDVSLFGVIIFFCYMAWRERVVRIAPEMRLPLITLLITAAIMPQMVSGSWGADFRLPVALPFLALASTQPRALRRSAVVFWSTAAVALLCVRVWSVSQSWYDMDQHFREFRSALSVMPHGARMFAVQSDMPDEAQKFSGVAAAIQRRSINAFWHVHALGVIDRGAFIPSLFTGWYPIQPAARNAGMSRIIGGLLTSTELAQFSHLTSKAAMAMPRNLLEPPCCLDWPHKYDFIFWIDFGHPPQVLPEHLNEAAHGSYFHIYRIVPGSG